MHDERAMTPNSMTDYMRMLDSLEMMLNHWEWVSAANEAHSKDGFLHVATQESKEKKRHLPNQYLSRRTFDKLEKQSAQVSLQLQAHTCASQECDTCILLWKSYTHCVIEVSGLDASAYLLGKPPREDAYGTDGDLLLFKHLEYPEVEARAGTGDGFDVPMVVARDNYAEMDALSRRLEKLGYCVAIDALTGRTPAILFGEKPVVTITIPYLSYMADVRERILERMDTSGRRYKMLPPMGLSDHIPRVFQREDVTHGRYPMLEKWFWDMEERAMETHGDVSPTQFSEEVELMTEETEDAIEVEEQKESFGSKFFRFMFGL
jgi:hypothetical protein